MPLVRVLPSVSSHFHLSCSDSSSAAAVEVVLPSAVAAVQSVLTSSPPLTRAGVACRVAAVKFLQTAQSSLDTDPGSLQAAVGLLASQVSAAGAVAAGGGAAGESLEAATAILRHRAAAALEDICRHSKSCVSPQTIQDLAALADRLSADPSGEKAYWLVLEAVCCLVAREEEDTRMLSMMEGLCRPCITAVEEVLTSGSEARQDLCTRLDSLAIVLRDTAHGIREIPQRLAAVCVHSTYLYATEWAAVSFASEGPEVQRALCLLTERLAAAGFEHIKNHGDLEESSDMVEDCFGMLSRLLRRCPQLAAVSPSVLKQFLPSLVPRAFQLLSAAPSREKLALIEAFVEVVVEELGAEASPWLAEGLMLLPPALSANAASRADYLVSPSLPLPLSLSFSFSQLCSLSLRAVPCGFLHCMRLLSAARTLFHGSPLRATLLSLLSCFCGLRCLFFVAFWACSLLPGPLVALVGCRLPRSSVPSLLHWCLLGLPC
ncbi:hypothetical protein cyc_06844 [Cyclospora cayetanensis]|uniref:MMS19 nucleotide excision repair protein n=1 Tax=Cyclospora cayetanensis TaxID=88456 RepID=A0A1D3CUD4_9EIME|nr:hypothetical protein cyc_06844 [Cyclospora cayetanensis]